MSAQGQTRSRGWWWRSPAARRLAVWLAVLLIVALVSGPDGSQTHYAYGFTHSILRPRIFGFLAVAVAGWALFEVYLGPLRQPAARAWQGAMQSVRGATRPRPVRLAGPLVALGIAVLLPYIPVAVGGGLDTWRTVLVTEVGIYVLLALGLNVVVGFAGLLDLGYIAFFAIGSYTTAYLTGRLAVVPPFSLNPFWILPIAVVVALIAGLVLGAPTLRLRGDYLAIVTLGFGEIVFDFARIKTDVTNGDSGAFGIPPFSIHIGPVKYTWGASLLSYYWLILAMVVIVLFLFRRLEDSRVGRAWAAIREDEIAAAASGIPTVKYKLMAFAIGASTSGLAGVFFAAQGGLVTPGDFTLQFSILVLVLVIFGGMGSIWGVAIGAAVLEWLPERLRNVVLPGDRFIYFGAIIILMMILRPQGLIPSRRRAREIAMAESGLAEGDALALPKETGPKELG